MIELTIRLGTKQICKSFVQDSIFLAKNSKDLEDLSLNFDSLLPSHIHIFKQQDQFFAQNLANDPFATINGSPFGKKQLKNGDCLLVGELEVTFTLKPEEQEESRQNEIEEEGLAALIQEVERLAEEKQTLLGAEPDQFIKEFKIKKKSSSRKVQSEVIKQHFAPSQKTEGISWPFMLAIASSILAIILAICAVAYLIFAEKNDQQEYRAARTLADVAVALTYAQQQQLKPANQNWADPDFMNHALSKVLPAQSFHPLPIDKHGCLTDCPYLLRVYTNTDSSRFLLVAQPEPSLWQWLLARETLLVDSHTMELHYLTDLRALNRLLAVSTPLEGASALEISHLIDRSPLISLHVLAAETERPDLMPPKELKRVLPGADFRIYNLPRYYQLSNGFVQSIADNRQEQKELHKEITRLIELPQLIFYTTLTPVESVKVRSILQRWFPNLPIVMTQIELEPQSNSVLSSYVLEKEWQPSKVEAKTKESSLTALIEEIDRPSITFAELTDKLVTRREVLLSYKAKIDGLIDYFIHSPSDDFISEAISLLYEIDDIELAEQLTIKQSIVSVYQKYVLRDHTITHADFLSQIEQLQLSPYLPTELIEKEEREGLMEAKKKSSFSEIIDNIESAVDLKSIENAVTVANSYIIKNASLDTDQLQKLRNRLQLQSLYRLEELILAPSNLLTEEQYTEESRNCIINILLSTGVTDEAIYDYYQREFDLLLEQKSTQEIDHEFSQAN